MTKDTNIYAAMGWKNAGFTDEDYITEFGLDPKQDINTQMFSLVEKENTAAYINQGMSVAAAKDKARQLRKTAESNFKRAVEEKKKQK